MPAHKRSICHCNDCNICHLWVCRVCGAYEGSLTQDCPGVHVDFDTQERVYKHGWDYSDVLGWHERGRPKTIEDFCDVNCEPETTT